MTDAERSVGVTGVVFMTDRWRVGSGESWVEASRAALPSLITHYPPPITMSAIISPIGIADVAAGDGALHTWSIRSDSRKRKSCTNVPSRVTAWARMPAVYGKRSLTVRIGQYLRHSRRYADLRSDPVSSARTDVR